MIIIQRKNPSKKGIYTFPPFFSIFSFRANFQSTNDFKSKYFPVQISIIFISNRQMYVHLIGSTKYG